MKLSQLILQLAGELYAHGDVEVEFLDDERYVHQVQGVKHDVIGGCVQLTYEEV